MWNAIHRARDINGYGLDNPRLDRLQGLDEFSRLQKTPSFRLNWLDILTFNLSSDVHKRLISLWNGRVVYQRHWGPFFATMRQDWLRMGGVGVVMWLGNTTLLASGCRSVFVFGSTALSLASACLAFLLHQKHADHLLSTGSDIGSYVMRVESVSYGLRPVAIIYILPQALVVYAGLCFNAALISIAAGTKRLTEAVVLLIFLGISTFPILGTLAFFSDSPTLRSVEKGIGWVLSPVKRLVHGASQEKPAPDNGRSNMNKNPNNE